jgi:hypothetical protein
MDLNSITERIKEKWQTTGRVALIIEINKRTRAGSTGGEIAAGVGRFLLDLKTKDPGAFNTIKDLIDEYIKECAKYNLYFKGKNIS